MVLSYIIAALDVFMAFLMLMAAVISAKERDDGVAVLDAGLCVLCAASAWCIGRIW